MKYIKLLFMIFIILFILVPTNVMAVEQTGFQTSKVDKDKLETYLDNFNVSLLSEAPKNLAIRCFDVSESGLVAIGNQERENCVVQVYDPNFKFLYGFEFECMGSYNIEWNNEYINIYFVRSDIAVTYNSNSEIVNIEKIDDTMDNNSYWYVLRSTERQIDSVKYNIKNNMGILNFFIGQSGYSQLVKTDDFGNKTVLYDVNSFMLIKTICIMLFLTIFIFSVIFCIIFNVKKHNSVLKGN